MSVEKKTRNVTLSSGVRISFTIYINRLAERPDVAELLLIDLAVHDEPDEPPQRVTLNPEDWGLVMKEFQALFIKIADSKPCDA